MRLINSPLDYYLKIALYSLAFSPFWQPESKEGWMTLCVTFLIPNVDTLLKPEVKPSNQFFLLKNIAFSGREINCLRFKLQKGECKSRASPSPNVSWQQRDNPLSSNKV